MMCLLSDAFARFSVGAAKLSVRPLHRFLLYASLFLRLLVLLHYILLSYVVIFYICFLPPCNCFYFKHLHLRNYYRVPFFMVSILVCVCVWVDFGSIFIVVAISCVCGFQIFLDVPW